MIRWVVHTPLCQCFRTRFFSISPTQLPHNHFSHAVLILSPTQPPLPSFYLDLSASTTPYILRPLPEVRLTVYGTNPLFCAILCFSYLPTNVVQTPSFSLPCFPTHPGSCLRPCFALPLFSASHFIPLALLPIFPFFLPIFVSTTRRFLVKGKKREWGGGFTKTAMTEMPVSVVIAI